MSLGKPGGVQRTASITAAPERVIRRFNTWNPFERKAPNLRSTYRGAETGRDLGRGTI